VHRIGVIGMIKRKIGVGEIWDGDIIAVSSFERLDNDFVSRKYRDHFVLRKRFYYVEKAGNNFVKAVNHRGKRVTFGYNEIEEAFRIERMAV